MGPLKDCPCRYCENAREAIEFAEAMETNSVAVPPFIIPQTPEPTTRTVRLRNPGGIDIDISVSCADDYLDKGGAEHLSRIFQRLIAALSSEES